MNMVGDSVDTLARRRELLGTPYRLFYSEPVELVRGDGTWVFDADGERYLDAYNNVPCVGHSHPRVVEALSRQASLLNTHTRYLSKVTLEYAERLLDTLPAELGHVMFTCSGSEANDLALQLARRWTGNAGVIVTSHAYHGTTTATAALSPSLDPTMVAVDQVELVRAPPSATGSSEDVDAFGRRVAAAVDALAARGVRPAALLADSVLSSDGLVPAPAGFLAAAAAAVRAAGGLYISDEVQAGSVARAKCGGSNVIEWCPTSSRWASRWATAIRSPAWPRARTSSMPSAGSVATSTRSPALRSPAPRVWRSSTCSRMSDWSSGQESWARNCSPGCDRSRRSPPFATCGA